MRINRTKTFIIALFILACIAGVTGQVFAQTLKEQDATAQQKYAAAQQRYQNAVNAYKNAREDYLAAQKKYQQLKNAENKAALEQKAKTYLSNAVEAIINRLEALRDKAENTRGISDADRAAVLAEIDKDINWLKERQGKIEIATPAQIKEEAKTAREYWKNVRASVKRITGEILAARINFVIAKADSFSARVDAKIAELKAAGKDTTQLEAWFADYTQKLVLAKEKYAAAKAKFSAISNLADADKLFREGHQFVKDANQYVKQAHAQLMQIVKEMKKMGDGSATTTQ